MYLLCVILCTLWFCSAQRSHVKRMGRFIESPLFVLYNGTCRAKKTMLVKGQINEAPNCRQIKPSLLLRLGSKKFPFVNKDGLQVMYIVYRSTYIRWKCSFTNGSKLSKSFVPADIRHTYWFESMMKTVLIDIIYIADYTNITNINVWTFLNALHAIFLHYALIWSCIGMHMILIWWRSWRT